MEEWWQILLYSSPERRNQRRCLMGGAWSAVWVVRNVRGTVGEGQVRVSNGMVRGAAVTGFT